MARRWRRRGGGGGGGGGSAGSAAAAAVAPSCGTWRCPIPTWRRRSDLAHADRRPTWRSRCALAAVGKRVRRLPAVRLHRAQNCNVEDTTTRQRRSASAAGTTPDWNNCSGNGDRSAPSAARCVDGVCSPFCGTTARLSAGCSAPRLLPGRRHGEHSHPRHKVCSQLLRSDEPAERDRRLLAVRAERQLLPGSRSHYAYCLGPTTASGTQGTSCTDAAGTRPTRPSARRATTASDLSGTCYKHCATSAARASARARRRAARSRRSMYAGARRNRRLPVTAYATLDTVPRADYDARHGQIHTS